MGLAGHLPCQRRVTTSSRSTYHGEILHTRVVGETKGVPEDDIIVLNL